MKLPSNLNLSSAPEAPPAFRIEAAMRLLGIRRTMMYSLIGAGLVPTIRLGSRCTLVPAQALDNLLALPQAEIDAALAAYKQRRGSR